MKMVWVKISKCMECPHKKINFDKGFTCCTKLEYKIVDEYSIDKNCPLEVANENSRKKG